VLFVRVGSNFGVIQIASDIPFRSIFFVDDLYATTHFLPDELFQINRSRWYVVFVHHCSYPLCTLASIPSAELGVPNDGALLIQRLEHPLQAFTRFGFFQLNIGELNPPISAKRKHLTFPFPFWSRYAVCDSHSSFTPRLGLLFLFFRA